MKQAGVSLASRAPSARSRRLLRTLTVSSSQHPSLLRMASSVASESRPSAIPPVLDVPDLLTDRSTDATTAPTSASSSSSTTSRSSSSSSSSNTSMIFEEMLRDEDIIASSSATSQTSISSISRGGGLTSPSSRMSIRFDIPADSQLDLTQSSEHLSVTLLSGDAEIQGCPLPSHEPCSLQHSQGLGIHSWKGCTIQLSSHSSHSLLQISQSARILYADPKTKSPLRKFLNLHAFLTSERNKAKEQSTVEKKDGPKLLVLGSTDSGKSTLCRTLCNYAVRKKDPVLLIDCDCGQNSLSVPGSLAVSRISQYIAPLKQSSDLLHFDREMCVFSYGCPSPTMDLTRYIQCVKRLSQVSQTQMDHCGCIINTCGMIDFTQDELAWVLVSEIIQAFDVDNVVILRRSKENNHNTNKTDEEIDDSDVESAMQQRINKVFNEQIQNCAIIESNPAISPRSTITRRKYRDTSIGQYFFGISDMNSSSMVMDSSCLIKRGVLNDDQSDDVRRMHSSKMMIKPLFHPFKISLPFSDFPLYGIFSNNNNNTMNHDESLNVKKMRLNERMKGQLIAITHAQSPDELISSNVAGYLCISDVNLENKSVQILMNSVGAFPGLLLSTRVNWFTMDQWCDTFPVFEH